MSMEWIVSWMVLHSGGNPSCALVSEPPSEKADKGTDAFSSEENSSYFNSQLCSNFTEHLPAFQFFNWSKPSLTFPDCMCIYSHVALNQSCLCFCDLCFFFLKQENIHYQMLWEQYSNWRLFYMKMLLIVPPLEISRGSSLPAKWISKNCSWKLLIYNTITQHSTCSLSMKSFCDQWFTPPSDYSLPAQTVS